jgi:hypothetical protein
LAVENHTKRLININADCFDENRAEGDVRRIVAITTLFTDSLSESHYPEYGLTPDNADVFVVAKMTQLHQESKKAFGNVISDEMCRRIGLID